MIVDLIILIQLVLMTYHLDANFRQLRIDNGSDDCGFASADPVEFYGSSCG